MSKIVPGDVFEMDVGESVCFLQFALRAPQWGHLIRVLPGLHEKGTALRPDLLIRKERFVTFFPLLAALKAGCVRKVGNVPLPVNGRELPLFRMRGHIDRDGRVLDWWLWDGESERKADTSVGGFWELPILEVCNDTILRERVLGDWVPANVR